MTQPAIRSRVSDPHGSTSHARPGSTTLPATAQLPQLDGRLTLTISETCHVLGVGETTLRWLINSGQLPVLRVGRRVLVPRQAVETMVAQVCSTTVNTMSG